MDGIPDFSNSSTASTFVLSNPTRMSPPVRCSCILRRARRSCSGENCDRATRQEMFLSPHTSWMAVRLIPKAAYTGGRYDYADGVGARAGKGARGRIVDVVQRLCRGPDLVNGFRRSAVRFPQGPGDCRQRHVGGHGHVFYGHASGRFCFFFESISGYEPCFWLVVSYTAG